jgi:pyruvate dehydrogenase E1 component alpha subunit
MLKRGGTCEGIMSELMGRATGHSRGKGGSMHLYSPKYNFYGGNGIVGAQCPVGTGIAFKHKYSGDGHVCVAMFGDGAANQGQLSEAMNMAYLWKLPVLYCCENNHFGMGTSTARASSCASFYSRDPVVPGIKIDGMDVFAVREGFKFAAAHSREGKGPVYVELDTYRYHGHSMSDPGSTYRTRDDVNAVRESRDPIQKLKATILRLNLATEEELKTIENEVRREVDEATEKAKAAPFPDESEVYTDVYLNNAYPVRANDGKIITFGK